MADDEELDGYEAVVVDLDGEEFELIDTVELDGKLYAALTPYTEEDDLPDEDVEFIILEMIDQADGDQCTLKTVDDEALYERVGEAFLSLFSEEFGEADDEE
ncbi:MAG: DUF1292 domain-containing protein [Bacteroides sp.]|nr:DUF1292 domain-containing protein [Eubacterium sp.]MCM1418549.1 DUF1292 domain-containing protein [Roseburia sp.]MCM1462569.1 DUF1292 domain-containing protein [Bacteroides sp.]